MTAPDRILLAVARALSAARDDLNALDSVAGDGDMGITADSIATVLTDLAPEVVALEPAAALRRLGLEIGQRAPSTFGTLVSLGLLAAARSAAPDGEASPTAALAAYAAAAAAAIAQRGKVDRGDKSLLDALGPAVDALATAAAEGATLTEGLARAARAAQAGADATASMDPRVGRQSWLADRARGHVDPGARAIALAFAAAAAAARPEVLGS